MMTVMKAVSWQIGRFLAAAEKRILGEHTINLAHQFQCFVAEHYRKAMQ